MDTYGYLAIFVLLASTFHANQVHVTRIAKDRESGSFSRWYAIKHTEKNARRYMVASSTSRIIYIYIVRTNLMSEGRRIVLDYI